MLPAGGDPFITLTIGAVVLTGGQSQIHLHLSLIAPAREVPWLGASPKTCAELAACATENVHPVQSETRRSGFASHLGPTQ